MKQFTKWRETEKVQAAIVHACQHMPQMRSRQEREGNVLYLDVTYNPSAEGSKFQCSRQSGVVPRQMLGPARVKICENSVKGTRVGKKAHATVVLLECGNPSMCRVSSLIVRNDFVSQTT